MTYSETPRPREPMFTMPGSVTGFIGIMLLVHAVRAVFLSPAQDGTLILLFSFIPVRYLAIGEGIEFPGGLLAAAWSPFSYALLHGSVAHLAVNAIWLAAFGSALARRFGTARFLAFSAFASAAGAGAHYFFHSGEFVPVIGASAAVSGHMAAVSRFMFQAGGPLRARRGPTVWQAEALPLTRIWTDRRVVAFLGVWFALNLAVGLMPSAFAGEDVAVAWEAHIGGFLFGLLAFALFDPPPEQRLRRALLEAPPASEPD